MKYYGNLAEGGNLLEIINWKELLYPYEQAMEELLLKFKNLDKECRHLGIYSPIDSVTGRLKCSFAWIASERIFLSVFSASVRRILIT